MLQSLQQEKSKANRLARSCSKHVSSFTVLLLQWAWLMIRIANTIVEATSPGVFTLQASALHLTSGTSATYNSQGSDHTSELCLKGDQFRRDTAE